MSPTEEPPPRPIIRDQWTPVEEAELELVEAVAVGELTQGSKESPDGLIAQAQKSLEPEEDVPPPHPLRHEFEHYDGDGDGVLSQAEVYNMMLDLGYQEPDSTYLAKVNRVFGKYDADGSGGASCRCILKIAPLPSRRPPQPPVGGRGTCLACCGLDCRTLSLGAFAVVLPRVWYFCGTRLAPGAAAERRQPLPLRSCGVLDFEFRS